MDEVKYGDKMMYVPSHEVHGRDTDAKGQYLFAFHHDDKRHPKHGQEVDLHLLHQAKVKNVPDHAGKPVYYLGETDQKVKAGLPTCHWQAVVIGITEGGKANLRIYHPDPGQGTRDCNDVPIVDPGLEPKLPHSCYKVEKWPEPNAADVEAQKM